MEWVDVTVLLLGWSGGIFCSLGKVSRFGGLVVVSV